MPSDYKQPPKMLMKLKEQAKQVISTIHFYNRNSTNNEPL